MICRKESGKVFIYKLGFYGSKVDLNNMDEGVELDLDVNYWETKVELYREKHLEHLLNSRMEARPDSNPSHVKYFSNYWIHRSFYNHIKHIGAAFQLSERHIHNLIAPLAHVEMAATVRHMRNKKVTSEQFDQLVRLVHFLDEDFSEIKSIRVETGRLVGWDSDTGEQKIEIGEDEDEKDFKFKFDTYFIRKTIRELLVKWKTENESFKSLIENSEHRGWSEFNIAKEERHVSKQMTMVVYEYIVNHGLHERNEPIINKKDSGFNHACRLTGFMFEAAKLSRLIERLQHIKSVEKKRHDHSLIPDIISGDRKNPINVIPDIRSLNLSKILKPHGLGPYIDELGVYGVRDNIQEVIEKVEDTISLMGSLSYLPADKLVDRYRKTIKDLLGHLEK